MIDFDKTIEAYWSDPEVSTLFFFFSAKNQIISTFGFVGNAVSVGAI